MHGFWACWLGSGRIHRSSASLCRYVPTGPQREDYRLDVARVIRQTQMEYDLDVD